MRKFKADITYVLDNNNGREIDIAYSIYRILVNSNEKAPQLLRYFFESATSYSYEEKENAKQLISDKSVEAWSDKYTKDIILWLNKTVDSDPSVSSFYESLWNFIISTKQFKTEKIKAFALYCVWMDPRIPYFNLKKGKTLDDNQFIKSLDNTFKDRLKAKQIIFSVFDKRTDEASVLLKLIEGLDNEADKAVLLAYIIRIVEVRTFERIATQKDKQDNEQS